MPVSEFGFPTPAAFSGGADFSPLANLGTQFSQGIAANRQQAALSQLGNDPNTNAAALIKSGDPQLAAYGINLQNKLREEAEVQREFSLNYGLRQRADIRAERTSKRENMTEAEKLAELRAGLQSQKIDPDSDFGKQVMFKIDPGAARRAEAELKLQQDTGQRAAAQEGRAAELYKATQTEEGRKASITAAGGNPEAPEWQTYVATGAGAPDVNKIDKVGLEQREVNARIAQAKALGYPDAVANYYGLNKKFPKDELSPDERKDILTAEQNARLADDVVGNLKKLKELSPQSLTGGFGSFATGAGQYLPEWATPQSMINTQELANITHQNVLEQLKPLLGSRPAVYEAQLLKQLETTPQMSNDLRQRIYDRLITAIQGRADEARREAEGIRNKTFFKPQQKQDQTAAATTENRGARATGGGTALKTAPDRLVNQSKFAIGRGADPKAVRQRLIDNGYEPGDIGQ